MRKVIGTGCALAAAIGAWMFAACDAGDTPEPGEVLVSPLAGRWYPAEPQRLRADLEKYLKDAGGEKLDGVIALIAPHAGYAWSGATAAHGYGAVRGKKYDRVVVIGPSHRIPMRNVASVPDATAIETPLGRVPVDRAFVRALKRHRMVQSIPPAHAAEHSVQIQLPWLQLVLGRVPVVPIVVGQLDADATRRLARILRGLIDAKTLVVASSDFTHYGPRYSYRPFADDVAQRLKHLDLGAWEFIRERDAAGFAGYVERTGATICGRCAIGVLLEMAPKDAQARLLAYDTSGRVGGDYTNSVSYLGIAFTGAWPATRKLPEDRESMPLSEPDRKLLLRLARETLRHAFDHDEPATPERLGLEIPESLRRPAGVFVTLHRGHALRGCRGVIYATTPLFRAVMQQTLDTAFRDTRFEPVRRDELGHLRFSISILTPPRKVASPEEIELGRHGIILSKSGYRALFLPQVAPEQGWTLPETLDHLARKAGLAPGAWREGAQFEVFEAEVIAEEPE